MAIKIDMLRCFQAVAGQGSLAAAATALGRTPSAVSMMLKQFEDHIGAPLFETTRKARLTPLGALILAEAQRELGHFDRTIQAIEGLSQAKLGSAGSHAIGGSDGFAAGIAAIYARSPQCAYRFAGYGFGCCG